MKTKVLIILIILIGLGAGGFFVWKNISVPEVEEEILPITEEAPVIKKEPVIEEEEKEIVTPPKDEVEEEKIEGIALPGEEKIETLLVVSCISGDNVCPIGCPYQIDKDCETPKTWDLIASNKPTDYLGDNVGYTTPSDWRHYEPLVKKVNEITKGLDNDFDKAKAIATWVKHSKRYGGEGTSIANQWGSVIDIFNAQEGVCLDATFLTTAMMRIARIPARSIFPNYALSHAFTDVYINGKWTVIDTTFGVGEPNFIPESLIIPELSLGAIFFEPYEFKESLFKELYRGEVVEFENVILYKRKSIPKESFGKITFPFSDTKIYVNDDFSKFSLERKGDMIEAEVSDVSCWWHFLDPYTTMFSPAGFYSVGFRTSWQKYVSGGVSGKQGYIKASLPEGKYKIICGLGGTPEVNPIAITEFTIQKNRETVITVDSFRKAEGASNEQFNTLMTLFNF